MDPSELSVLSYFGNEIHKTLLRIISDLLPPPFNEDLLISIYAAATVGFIYNVVAWQYIIRKKEKDQIYIHKISKKFCKYCLSLGVSDSISKKFLNFAVIFFKHLAFIFIPLTVLVHFGLEGSRNLVDFSSEDCHIPPALMFRTALHHWAQCKTQGAGDRCHRMIWCLAGRAHNVWHAREKSGPVSNTELQAKARFVFDFYERMKVVTPELRNHAVLLYATARDVALLCGYVDRAEHYNVSLASMIENLLWFTENMQASTCHYKWNPPQPISYQVYFEKFPGKRLSNRQELMKMFKYYGITEDVDISGNEERAHQEMLEAYATWNKVIKMRPSALSIFGFFANEDPNPVYMNWVYVLAERTPQKLRYAGLDVLEALEQKKSSAEVKQKLSIYKEIKNDLIRQGVTVMSKEEHDKDGPSAELPAWLTFKFVTSSGIAACLLGAWYRYAYHAELKDGQRHCRICGVIFTPVSRESNKKKKVTGPQPFDPKYKPKPPDPSCESDTDSDSDGPHSNSVGKMITRRVYNCTICGKSFNSHGNLKHFCKECKKHKKLKNFPVFCSNKCEKSHWQNWHKKSKNHKK